MKYEFEKLLRQRKLLIIVTLALSTVYSRSHAHSPEY